VAGKTYFPDRGDFIHLNFSPSTGHEMADRHYALVLSTASFTRVTNLALVCPITSTIRAWPFSVHVPPGTLPPKQGVAVASSVLTDQVKTVDCREREMEFVARAPEEVLDEALAKVRAIVDSDDVIDELGAK
jgi:mRNA interferase MazF